MIPDAIAAYAHYIAIFATAVLLGSEAVIYRRALSAVFVRLLQRLDLYFLFAAIALIVTGVGRVFASPKGWAFYEHNPVFWVKMALFLTLGILSIGPTMHFLSWNKTKAADGSVMVAPNVYARVRAFLTAEVIVLFLIPLFASLMSRGVGLR
ncbi:MAG TPA: DUF2214 family protein [Candidatus Baltobacteraceae bacterium]|jgi:putative membrane protein|nr:DUF2214 family protein [Candidatus Baltobacteraceae bacterium]